MSDPSWPVRLAFRKSAQELFVEFEDGTSGVIPYKRLREESPSAEVRGHGSGPRPPQPPVPEDISVLGADPVGRYAIRIKFSDGHDSGLYTWKFLRELSAGA
ncbi:DUF971 domain-containing protein [uncultured Hyphomonas sp.]|jgi:DUF971 family protein|uniref:DUF971 domain-containing protein n=1 Tax=uncultured Hyphomonas sp. TaxID=225298 RepID=UPI000C589D17|nr:hypothetical protein [Hyphomonadaceae bacterium]MBA29177.1 hypothetical protein [Hyphomonadaceae bacterium]|tara:strand:- start:21002 stop:21307 length:306 start_codon:yes stop_codon:yes gene_type:complete